MKLLLPLCFLIFSEALLYAQQKESVFQEITLSTTAGSSFSDTSFIKYGGQLKMLVPIEESGFLLQLKVQDTADLIFSEGLGYDIVEPLYKQGNLQFGSIRFNEAHKIPNPAIKFKRNDSTIRLNLLFFCNQELQVKIDEKEAFVGEERKAKVLAKMPEAIHPRPTWTVKDVFSWKISFQEKNPFLVYQAKKPGTIGGTISVLLRVPQYKEGELVWKKSIMLQEIKAKPTTLDYVEFTQAEFTYDPLEKRKGYETTFSYASGMRTGKTYRLEKQSAPGGALYAELFVKEILASRKALGIIRFYNFHSREEGYLYIKDCDEAVFLTNLSVVPKPRIENLEIAKLDGEWSASKTVNPGTSIRVRLKGVQLEKAQISLGSLAEQKVDSVINSNEERIIHVKIPKDISSSSIPVILNKKPTGLSLKVKEFQRPRPLDFIKIDYGTRPVYVNRISSRILYDKPIQDITLNFERGKIDDEKIYGPQYLTLEVRITDKDGNLLEVRDWDNLVICPSEKSPRYGYYENRKCFTGELILNEYLAKKTYSLDDWSRVEIQIQHKEDFYEEPAYSKKIIIIRQEYWSFDVDVSFPAGLIIKKFGDEDFANLGGISMAMIGQFSFYSKEKLASFKPFKIGAGFIALNAFNFNENADDRDIGIVILGSVYPIRSRKRLSFPLYAGGGYLLNQDQWFMVLGPGIRINL